MQGHGCLRQCGSSNCCGTGLFGGSGAGAVRFAEWHLARCVCRVRRRDGCLGVCRNGMLGGGSTTFALCRSSAGGSPGPNGAVAGGKSGAEIGRALAGAAAAVSAGRFIERWEAGCDVWAVCGAGGGLQLGGGLRGSRRLTGPSHVWASGRWRVKVACIGMDCVLRAAGSLRLQLP